MKKRILTTTRNASRVSTSTLGASRVDPAVVRQALGAEPGASTRRAGAPSLLAALRRELSVALKSSGGRPALDGAGRRQKIPMTDADWEALEKVAQGIRAEGVGATPGLVAGQLLRDAIARLAHEGAEYREARDDRPLVISDSARVTAREQPKSGRPARRSALRAPWRALPIERSTLVELSVAGPPKNAFVTGRLLDGRRFEMPLEAGNTVVETRGDVVVETAGHGDVALVVTYRAPAGRVLVCDVAAVEYPGSSAEWENDVSCAVASARFVLRVA